MTATGKTEDVATPAPRVTSVTHAKSRWLVGNLSPKENRVIGVVPRGDSGYVLVSVVLCGARVKAVERTIDLSSDDDSRRAELKELGLHSGIPVVLGLPRRETLLKLIQIPSIEPDRIQRMIPFEIAAHLPWPAEEAIAGHQVLSTEDDGYASVILAMAQRRVVEEHLARLAAWGIRPSRVEATALSVCRLLPGIEADERPALLFVDDQGLTYIRSSQGRYVFSRGVAAGESACDVLRKSLDADQRLHGSTGVPTSVTVVCERAVDIASLQAALPSGVAVNEADHVMFAALNGAGALKANQIACVASALGGAETCCDANLLPEKQARAFIKRRLLRETQWLALLLVWTAAMLMGFGYYSFTKQRLHLAETKQAIAALEKDVGNLKAESQALDSLNIERRGVSVPLQVILELYKTTPDAIALTSLRYDSHGTLTLGGEAPGFKAVYEYLSALSKSSILRNIEMKHGARPGAGANAAGLVEFKVSCTVAVKERP